MVSCAKLTRSFNGCSPSLTFHARRICDFVQLYCLAALRVGHFRKSPVESTNSLPPLSPDMAKDTREFNFSSHYIKKAPGNAEAFSREKTNLVLRDDRATTEFVSHTEGNGLGFDAEAIGGKLSN